MTSSVQFKRGFFKLLFVGVLVAALAGCAVSPTAVSTTSDYQEMADMMPTLGLGQGRIYFFRYGDVFSDEFGVYLVNVAGRESADQLSALESGGAGFPFPDPELVGISQPAGFFFVDRPAGNYIAITSLPEKSAEENSHLFARLGFPQAATFVLGAGETKYLRIIGISLETSDKAMSILPRLWYTGDYW